MSDSPQRLPKRLGYGELSAGLARGDGVVVERANAPLRAFGFGARRLAGFGGIVKKNLRAIAGMDEGAQ